MPLESWSYRIVDTGPFRHCLRHQTRASHWSRESYETLSSTGNGRAMRTALTYHEPPEELCMLSSLDLTAWHNATLSGIFSFISDRLRHILNMTTDWRTRDIAMDSMENKTIFFPESWNFSGSGRMIRDSATTTSTFTTMTQPRSQMFVLSMGGILYRYILVSTYITNSWERILRVWRSIWMSALCQKRTVASIAVQ